MNLIRTLLSVVFASASLASAAPQPPPGVYATDGEYSTHVRISWSMSPGSTGYTIYRNTSYSTVDAVSLGSTSATEFSDTTGTAGVTYWYFVTASNATGSSGFSAGDSGYRTVAMTPPASVTASDGTSPSVVTVSWSAVPGALGYRIYRNEGNSTVGLTDLGTSSGTGFTDSTALSGVTYWYFVTASNATSTSGYSAGDAGYLEGTVLDDHGNTFATATVLSGGEGGARGALGSGDTDMFRVSVPGAGVLIAWTEGITNTLGSLHASSGNGLGSNDNLANPGNGAILDLNFRVSAKVTQGNHYISVSGAAGSYHLRWRFVAANAPPAFSLYRITSGGDVVLGVPSQDGVTCNFEWSTDLRTWINAASIAGYGNETVWVVNAQQTVFPKGCHFRAYHGVPQWREFSHIPAGSFVMGDQSGPPTGSTGERPAHGVQVGGFYLAQCETTKSLWNTVRTWGLTHGYADLAAGAGKDANYPIHAVPWHDVLKWCNARSEMEGLAPCYTLAGAVYRTGQYDTVACDWNAGGYRLPTEAEWEKAARGQLAGQVFPWGNTITHSQANYQSDAGLAYDTSPTRGYHPTWKVAVPYTAYVRSFPPNGYGLCDMAGNLAEWCWDRYSSDYYVFTPAADPRGPDIGQNRVVRGGSWFTLASECRVSSRFFTTPGLGYNMIGFRVARGLGQ